MKKILLLDDNLDILEVVEEVLTYEGFFVKATEKSLEFLIIAEKYRPDLIILDFRLSDGNGGDLCCALKAHPKLNQIPVIMFSAYVQQDFDLFQFGCEAVIHKPFDIDHLVQTIRKLIADKNVSSAQFA